jgi:hypothetical protein
VSRKRLTKVGSALVGIPLSASIYRRLVASRQPPKSLRFVVRVSVDKELVSDLAILVRAVQGRAVLEDGDALSVPLAQGTKKEEAYRDLRALLDKWELQHPGIRLRILDEPDVRAGRKPARQSMTSMQNR